MTEPTSRQQHAFLVRIWFEPACAGTGPDPGAQGSGQWRGSIEHVGTGVRMYFTSLQDITDFIALRLKEPSMSIQIDQGEQP